MSHFSFLVNGKKDILKSYHPLPGINYYYSLNGRKPHWKTLQWKKTKIEDNHNGRQPRLKTTSMEDDLNGRRS